MHLALDTKHQCEQHQRTGILCLTQDGEVGTIVQSIGQLAGLRTTVARLGMQDDCAGLVARSSSAFNG